MNESKKVLSVVQYLDTLAKSNNDELSYFIRITTKLNNFYWTKVDQDRFIVEQFTGKKDIANLDIYEGDIVGLHLAANYKMRNSPKFKETLGRYEVLWENGWNAFVLRVLEKNWFDSTFRIEEQMKKETIDWETCPGVIITQNYLCNYGSLEVIGNVHV